MTEAISCPCVSLATIKSIVKWVTDKKIRPFVRMTSLVAERVGVEPTRHSITVFFPTVMDHSVRAAYHQYSVCHNIFLLCINKCHGCNESLDKN